MRQAVNAVANSASLTEFVYLIGKKFVTVFLWSLARPYVVEGITR
jgi:hypothetical protein